MRKGQPALEVLSTYAWAILIIVIAASILFASGLINFNAPPRHFCEALNGFEIKDFVADNQGNFSILVSNSGDMAVNISSAVFTLNNQSSTSYSIGDPVLSSEEQTLITFHGLPSLSVGSPYDGELKIYYNVVGGIQNRVSEARCYGKIEGQALVPHCFNGVQDGGETDVDCGGSCGANCEDGQHCLSDADCVHRCNTSTSPSICYNPAGDTTPPAIILNSPANNSVDYDGDVSFNYTPYDASGVYSCSLYINNTLWETDYNIENNQSNYFNESFSRGEYSWKIKCTDNSLSFNQGESEERFLYVSAIDLLVGSVYVINVWDGDGDGTNDDVLVGAVIYNDGTLNASNATLRLLVNGTENDSKISSVPPGYSFYTFEWNNALASDTSADGAYNLTVNLTCSFDVNTNNNANSTFLNVQTLHFQTDYTGKWSDSVSFNTLNYFKVRNTPSSEDAMTEIDLASELPATVGSDSLDLDEVAPSDNYTWYNSSQYITADPQDITVKTANIQKWEYLQFIFASASLPSGLSGWDLSLNEVFFANVQDLDADGTNDDLLVSALLNNNSSSAPGVNVSLFINGTLNSSKIVTLSSGNSTVNFSVLNFMLSDDSADGDYNFSATVSFSGDENASNNENNSLLRIQTVTANFLFTDTWKGNVSFNELTYFKERNADGSDADMTTVNMSQELPETVGAENLSVDEVGPAQNNTWHTSSDYIASDPQSMTIVINSNSDSTEYLQYIFTDSIG